MLSDGQEILEGRFIIQKKLGSGAFGEIYKGKYARHLLKCLAALYVAKQMPSLGDFEFEKWLHAFSTAILASTPIHRFLSL